MEAAEWPLVVAAGLVADSEGEESSSVVSEGVLAAFLGLSLAEEGSESESESESESSDSAEEVDFSLSYLSSEAAPALFPLFSLFDLIAIAFETFFEAAGASGELFITFLSCFIPSSIFLVSFEAFDSTTLATDFADPFEDDVIDGFSLSSSSPSSSPSSSSIS